MAHTKSHRLEDIGKRLAAEKVSREEAKFAGDVIAIWNARQAAGEALWFYPTIGAALASKHVWLVWSCPACRTTGDFDLRDVDRHPRAPISSLIPLLKCTRCPTAPFAKLEGLARQTPAIEDRAREEHCGRSIAAE